MDAPRHAEVTEYGSVQRVPYGRPGATTEREELHRLLREATRLIERADLRGASERLRKAGELASGNDPRDCGEARVEEELPGSGVSTRSDPGEAASGRRSSGSRGRGSR